MIHPPDEDVGLCLSIDGTILGRAVTMRDGAAFIQEAGLHVWDEMDVRTSLIGWRGGTP